MVISGIKPWRNPWILRSFPGQGGGRLNLFPHQIGNHLWRKLSALRGGDERPNFIQNFAGPAGAVERRDFFHLDRRAQETPTSLASHQVDEENEGKKSGG